MSQVSGPVRFTLLAVGALLLVLVTALLVPKGDDTDGGLVPTTDLGYVARSAPTGRGTVDARMRSEIDRTLARDTGAGTRCATFEEQQYCLGVGWTDQAPARVQLELRRPESPRGVVRESTGDLDGRAWLARRAAEPAATRMAADKAELEAAAASVAKVVLLRHELLGEPLPDGFLQRHPEARVSLAAAQRTRGTSSPSPTVASTTATATATATTASASPSTAPSGQASQTIAPEKKRARDYPRKATVLDEADVREQTRTYWCGPTTMQMIAWGWQGRARSQQHWANRLGTTTGGTAITDMVRVVNSDTGWDRKDHAGPYITLDISDWSFRQWMLLQMRHTVDYRAPVIFHPILLKKYYPYLDDDASGHFQAGRGYNKRGKKPDLVSYFEPWNQQRFDPSEPYIDRVQWRQGYRSYRANEAHFQHNIGV
jgi:hypothetical protein